MVSVRTAIVADWADPPFTSPVIDRFAMASVSENQAATTSNLESLILRRVASVKNSTVAAAIGHDDGHVSRICSGERGLKLAELQPFLDALGLKVSECDGPMVSIPVKTLEALRHLVKESL